MKYNICFATILGSAACIAAVFLVFPQNIHAQSEYALGITPAFQEVVVDENASEKDVKFSIQNLADYAQEIEIFALDFRQIDDKGNIAFVDKPTDNFVLAKYVEIPTPRIYLPPKFSQDIMVQIKNDISLSPGGHYAAVIARTAQPSIALQGQHVLPGVSTLLLVRKVGGEQYHLSLSSIEQGGWLVRLTLPRIISLTFTNDGNTHVVPKGTVLMKDMFGRVVSKGIINDTSKFVLPETRRVISVTMEYLRMLPPIAFITASIDGNTTLETAQFTQQFTFIYVSPLVVLLAAAAAVSVIVVRNRRQKRGA